MRFIQAWADVADQNVVLKIVVGVLLVVSVALTIALGGVALKDPVVIDRGCVTRRVSANSQATPTSKEIEAFLKEVIPQRFNWDSKPESNWISIEEQKFRELEQAELEHGQVKSRVIVNQVTVEGTGAVVDADRMLSVGEVRSALAFPIRVELLTTARTNSNPYGLVLTKVSAIQNGKSAEKESGKK